MSVAELPEGWLELPTSKTFMLMSTTNKKIKIKDTKPHGLFPVVDQGGELISGFSDDSEKVIEHKNPVIIFGDHTRHIKWVDFPFIVGADGVKPLLPEPFYENRFFFYLLKSLNIKDRGYGRHFKLLKESTSVLPPLAEQKEIAKRLDDHLAQVETIKTKLDAIPKILATFRQSVLADAVSGKLTADWRKNKSLKKLNVTPLILKEREDLFGKKFKKPIFLKSNPTIDIPEEWQWVSVDSSCLKITDGTHHSPESYSEGHYKYITSKNVRNGFMDLSRVSYVTKEVHKEIYSRCDVKINDVLLVKDGANTGLCCVNTLSEEFSLLSSVGVLKTSSFLESKYLQYYFQSPIGEKYIKNVMGGTAIKRLTLKKIMNLPLSLPSLEEQTQIVARVEELFAFADNIEKQVNVASERVNLLTQSILAKAFRGDLTADWRADNQDLITGENSAAALLKKIQSAQTQGKKKT